MAFGIKSSLKILGTLLVVSSSVDTHAHSLGKLEQKYDDLEIVSTTDEVREVDGIESDVTLVTVKNTGDKLVDPESVISTVPNVVAAYSWEDNTGVSCLIDTNETFVFSINNYNKEGNILDYISIKAIDKDVTVLWTRGISAFRSDFCLDSNGDPDYKSLDLNFYKDENNPYLNPRHEILAQKGLAYYALDGVSYISFINGDELNIRSHDSLLNVDVAISHIDYFYASLIDYPSGPGNTPIIGQLAYLDFDFSILLKMPLIIAGTSLLGGALIVTLAIVSKKLVDKKNQGK